MPAGDSQRVWFPEMLTRLEREWGEAMSFVALIELRDSLDTLLHQIRSERHISSPVFTCPKCGLRGPMAEPQVSVRAMILALGRFGITTPAKTKTLEREWTKYRTSTLSISTARVSMNATKAKAVASRALLRRIKNGNAVSRDVGQQTALIAHPVV